MVLVSGARTVAVISTKTDRAVRGGYDRLHANHSRSDPVNTIVDRNRLEWGILQEGINASANACLCCKSQAAVFAPTQPRGAHEGARWSLFVCRAAPRRVRGRGRARA